MSRGALLLTLAAFAAAGRMGVPDCTVHRIEQPIDHFGYDASIGTYSQRYFVYDKYAPAVPRVVFFYTGNEDNVELYVNNTGVMWELAERFGALLVFAEHRYYGESMPGEAFPYPGCLKYLTTEQATADYAALIHALRGQYGDDNNAVKFIGFGGSYGGMLGSWMRMRYPDALDGMVAGSAPILSFEGVSPPYDPETYYRITTRDAGGPGSGAAAACAPNLKSAWPYIEQLGRTAGGRAELSRVFRTCAPLESAADVDALVQWLLAPVGYMAMGNYPYASDYMTHGDGKPMPAWPMRVACVGLAQEGLAGTALLEGVREFAAVYYNRTGVHATCYYNGAEHALEWPRGADGRVVRPTKPRTRAERDRIAAGIPPTLHGRPPQHPTPAPSCPGGWDYQYCTEMVQPFTQGLDDDMLYPASVWNATANAQQCKQTWGVTTRTQWAVVGFPGARLDDGRFSNIVFTNGYLDPWSGGGVLHNVSAERDILAYVLPNGAHHLDFMWSRPDDSPDAVDARRFIADAIVRWTQ